MSGEPERWQLPPGVERESKRMRRQQAVLGTCVAIAVAAVVATYAISFRGEADRDALARRVAASPAAGHDDAAFLAAARADPTGYADGHSDASLVAMAHAVCAAATDHTMTPATPPDLSTYPLALGVTVQYPGPDKYLAFVANPADQTGQGDALLWDAHMTLCPDAPLL